MHASQLSEIKGYLMEHESNVRKYFYTTTDQWNNLIQHIKNLQAERLWLFLIGCGYALDGEQGVKTLTRILAGSDMEQPRRPRIWFESQPLPPRMNEGNTSIDLALGTIALRGTTANGIGLDDSTQSWICFCEAKLKSDISLGVTHDPNRNQLARVIENAVCFQNFGKYADDVYVVVISCRAFGFYPQLEKKFKEYKANPKRLADEFIKCPLDKRNTSGWFYPSEDVLIQRVVSNLKLQWVYFEDLVENLPPSGVSEQLKHLWSDSLGNGY